MTYGTLKTRDANQMLAYMQRSTRSVNRAFGKRDADQLNTHVPIIEAVY